jgi:hypothetical protein
MKTTTLTFCTIALLLFGCEQEPTKEVRNEYGYICPLVWNEIPKRYKFITMHREEYQEYDNETDKVVTKVMLVVNNTKEMPDSLFTKNVGFIWDIKNNENHRHEFVDYKYEILENHTIRHTQDTVIDVRKCIWKRPQK